MVSKSSMPKGCSGQWAEGDDHTCMSLPPCATATYVCSCLAAAVACTGREIPYQVVKNRPLVTMMDIVETTGTISASHRGIEIREQHLALTSSPSMPCEAMWLLPTPSRTRRRAEPNIRATHQDIDAEWKEQIRSLPLQGRTSA